MTLNNIKQLRKDRGFTIVELLIVIIVIAILAAIVIVAYQGITAKANTSKAQTSGVSVQKKVEAFNADTANGNGNYPATATGATLPALAAGTGVAAPTTGITVVGPGGTAGTAPAATVFTSAANPSATVVYSACVVSGAAVGYYVAYYDFSQSKVVYLVGGTQIVANANNTVYPTVTGCTMSTT